MESRIADTFTDSLARLTGEEQKSRDELSQARQGEGPEVLVGAGQQRLHLFVHRTADSLLLCYMDHHDKAYAWAERRKLETHPTTGAAQLVEIREGVQEIVIPAYVEAPRTWPAPGRAITCW